MKISDSKFALSIVIPIIALLLALVVFPVLISLYTSFTSASVLSPNPLTSHFLWFQNYYNALLDPLVTTSLRVSLEFVIITVLMCVPLSLGLALLLNENLPGRRALWSLVLLPFVMSEFASGVIWSIMLNSSYGVVNGVLLAFGIIRQYMAFVTASTAMFVLALAYVWHLAPFGAFLILANLKSIPPEVYQSAKVDGANAFNRFRHITLPYVRYTVLITLILVTMQAFSAFDIVYALTSGGPGNATAGLTWVAYQQEFAQHRYGYASAVSYILLIIVLIIATVYFVILTRRKE